LSGRTMDCSTRKGEESEGGKNGEKKIITVKFKILNKKRKN
jgi:hypothetical protein